LRSPGASGRWSRKLGGALGAPEASREGPGSDFGSILGATGASQDRFLLDFVLKFGSIFGATVASQDRFLADFVLNFGCLPRRFRTRFALHCAPESLGNTFGDARGGFCDLGRSRCPLHVACCPSLFAFGSRWAPEALRERLLVDFCRFWVDFRRSGPYFR